MLIYYLVVILIGLFVVKIKNDKRMERDKYNIDWFVVGAEVINEE